MVKELLFLKKVRLSGYKSIENVNIEFQKGLNIIIGKNAAGKTNFLKFLYKNLCLDYDGLNNFSSELFFQNSKEISIEAKNNIEIKEILNQSDFLNKPNPVLKISGDIIDSNDITSSIKDKLSKNNIIFSGDFLCHGIPENYQIVDKQFSFRMQKSGLSDDLIKMYSNKDNAYYIRNWAVNLFLNIAGKNKEIDLKTFLDSFFKSEITLKNVLKKYSPIQDIRFSENYNVFIEDDNESITVNNLFLEFKVENNWIPFSSLSDGTKRLFYIISEVYDDNNSNDFSPTSIGLYSSVSKISRIILIEEPELGIHPHQFHKLMEFLKEESELKQIIITTHSPQALDCINLDELSRIIIAYSTNSKEGTKLRHLNRDELAKANEYIKDDFLSDYWLYSDLEK